MKEYTLRESNKALKKGSIHDAWVKNRRLNYSSIEGAYPLFASHAKGAYIWDVDNQRYIDYTMGYGTVILGHADDRVNEAVINEIHKGTCISPLWKTIQFELAETIKSVIPNSEQAFLMKTGSDATSGSVRLARCFTGRNKVIRWGYNGWHDWATPKPLGVPDYVKNDVMKLDYNCIEKLERIFKENKNEIACVIMMPLDNELPVNRFLHEVKAITNKYGAIFILDEMRTGFRVSLGGVQKFLDITPDLATYSKAMANGYPISAIVGREDILSNISQTKMTATYFGSTHEMIAAKTTIQILKETDTINHIWKLGAIFRKKMNALINKYMIPAKIIGIDPMLCLIFEGEKKEEYKRIFFGGCAKRGIFFHPNHHIYISGAHTEKDITDTVNICDEVFKILKS